MTRREALMSTMALFGGSLIGSTAFLSGCREKSRIILAVIGADEIALLNEIGDVIIPSTADSPGAKATGIGQFMKTIVMDCYDDDEQRTFLDGIIAFVTFTRQKTESEFSRLTLKQREDVITAIEQEEKRYTASKADDAPEHYFRMIKQLTIWGYLTSEQGATLALRFIPIPGKYESCIPYNGEPAWLY